ncbi:MAG: NTP transferase domain-containing protein [Bacteroidetes bacterium]|nr:NTP transferase domain-containing protein [Bacteroidota bacterium]MBS1591560.1 NTP transferase domain-containing protein [Bacteroidota bacterium]
MKAMIFAAGLGTRLKPFTDKHPKALAIVNNKTLLQRNIEYLQQFGIKNVIVNVHHFSNQIINILEKNKGWGSNIAISNETDEVLETGGGLKKAAWYFKNENDFVVMNADILTDMHLDEMIKQHQQKKCLATLAVSDRTSSRYFLFNENDELCGWQNINTNEQKIVRKSKMLIPKAFSGIHVINSSIFSLIQQEGKFSMVDVYLSLATTHSIISFNHSANKFIDVGKPENIIKAESLFI